MGHLKPVNNNFPQLLQLLMGKGVSREAIDKRNYTVYHYAAVTTKGIIEVSQKNDYRVWRQLSDCLLLTKIDFGLFSQISTCPSRLWQIEQNLRVNETLT